MKRHPGVHQYTNLLLLHQLHHIISNQLKFIGSYLSIPSITAPSNSSFNCPLRHSNLLSSTHLLTNVYDTKYLAGRSFHAHSRTSSHPTCEAGSMTTTPRTGTLFMTRPPCVYIWVVVVKISMLIKIEIRIRRVVIVSMNVCIIMHIYDIKPKQH